MWILIAIFIVSLLAVFGMLIHRAWQIETGKAEIVDNQQERMVIPEVTYASLKKNVRHYAKTGGKVVALGAMHVWVRGTHAAGKQMKKIGEKIVKKSTKENGEKTP